MKIILDKEWHHLPADKITYLLNSNLKSGIDQEEVTQRLDQFGANALTEKQGQSAWMRFLLQFHQPLIYILIAAGVITAALQTWCSPMIISVPLRQQLRKAAVCSTT